MFPEFSITVWGQQLSVGRWDHTQSGAVPFQWRASRASDNQAMSLTSSWIFVLSSKELKT